MHAWGQVAQCTYMVRPHIASAMLALTRQALQSYIRPLDCRGESPAGPDGFRAVVSSSQSRLSQCCAPVCISGSHPVHAWGQVAQCTLYAVTQARSSAPFCRQNRGRKVSIPHRTPATTRWSTTPTGGSWSRSGTA